MRQEIDWVYLLRMARLQGMMPLLHCHLGTICPDAVPKWVLDQLRNQSYAHIGQNLFLTEELFSLQKLFEIYGIIALPFKGPVLAGSVYGTLALREAGDLDILVRRRDVRSATALLVAQGYRPQREAFGREEQTYLRAACLLPEYHTAFVREDGRVCVELHWDIACPSLSYPVAVEEFWERAEWTPLGDVNVRTLAPEDLLLALCLHGAKHLWERLKWICDIAEFVRAYRRMDWQVSLDRARRFGKQRVVLLGLHLASVLLSAELPPEVAQRVQADPVVPVLGWQVRQRLFRGTDEPTGFAERWRFYLDVHERLQDRLRHRLRYLRLAITPTRAEREWLPLPAGLAFLHYFLRPVRLLGKYGLRAMKRFLRPVLPHRSQPAAAP